MHAGGSDTGGCIGRLRDECVNETIFTSLPQVRTMLAAWQRDDYTERPHGAIGNKVPTALMTSAHAASL